MNARIGPSGNYAAPIGRSVSTGQAALGTCGFAQPFLSRKQLEIGNILGMINQARHGDPRTAALAQAQLPVLSKYLRLADALRA
jgi:hypothetical protein